MKVLFLALFVILFGGFAFWFQNKTAPIIQARAKTNNPGNAAVAPISESIVNGVELRPKEMSPRTRKLLELQAKSSDPDFADDYKKLLGEFYGQPQETFQDFSRMIYSHAVAEQDKAKLFAHLIVLDVTDADKIDLAKTALTNARTSIFAMLVLEFLFSKIDRSEIKSLFSQSLMPEQTRTAILRRWPFLAQ